MKTAGVKMVFAVLPEREEGKRASLLRPVMPVLATGYGYFGNRTACFGEALAVVRTGESQSEDGNFRVEG